MKNQQVVVDYVYMLKMSFSCLCLAFAGWVLFKLVSACFWLPSYLQENEKLSQHLKQRYQLMKSDNEQATPEETEDDVTDNKKAN